jgi:hypothetical protein
VPDEDRPEPRSPLQTAANVAAALFLVLGVAGFVPGLVSHYNDQLLAGSHSTAELVGLFQVSVLGNVVAVALGLAGLALAASARGARLYLLAGGGVALGLGLLGLAVNGSPSANFIPLGSADNGFYLALGALMLALSLGLEPALAKTQR